MASRKMSVAFSFLLIIMFLLLQHLLHLQFEHLWYLTSSSSLQQFQPFRPVIHYLLIFFSSPILLQFVFCLQYPIFFYVSLFTMYKLCNTTQVATISGIFRKGTSHRFIITLHLPFSISTSDFYNLKYASIVKTSCPPELKIPKHTIWSDNSL